MAVWVIRAGRSWQDEYASIFFDENVALISFGLCLPLSEFSSRRALHNHLLTEAAHGPKSEGEASSATSQLLLFAEKIEIGDTILAPHSKRTKIAVGRVDGDCRHYTAKVETDGPSDRFHVRPVHWMDIEVPRRHFPSEWFKNRRTVFRPIGIDNDVAQAHIQQVVREHLGISG